MSEMTGADGPCHFPERVKRAVLFGRRLQKNACARLSAGPDCVNHPKNAKCNIIFMNLAI